jgi:hypothetical protein
MASVTCVCGDKDCARISQKENDACAITRCPLDITTVDAVYHIKLRVEGKTMCYDVRELAVVSDGRILDETNQLVILSEHHMDVIHRIALKKKAVLVLCDQSDVNYYSANMRAICSRSSEMLVDDVTGLELEPHDITVKVNVGGGVVKTYAVDSLLSYFVASQKLVDPTSRLPYSEHQVHLILQRTKSLDQNAVLDLTARRLPPRPFYHEEQRGHRRRQHQQGENIPWSSVISELDETLRHLKTSTGLLGHAMTRRFNLLAAYSTVSNAEGRARRIAADEEHEEEEEEEYRDDDDDNDDQEEEEEKKEEEGGGGRRQGNKRIRRQ